MWRGLAGTGKQKKSTPLQLSEAGAAHMSATSLAAAIEVFKNAEVVNFTNVQYQFFSKIDTKLFSGEIERVEYRPTVGLDHVVNKWERAEHGEFLDGYDSNGSAAAAEAAHLGMDPAEYRKLPASKKMQFAVLNYKNDLDAPTMRSWGQSYFVISKEKCKDDGFIHYGDSNFIGFMRSQGDYRNFADRLSESPYSVRMLNQELQEGEEAPHWIEVNLKGGINLPGDIEKFVVSEKELEGMKKYLSVDKAKQHLNGIYGEKVEYRP